VAVADHQKYLFVALVGDYFQRYWIVVVVVGYL